MKTTGVKAFSGSRIQKHQPKHIILCLNTKSFSTKTNLYNNRGIQTPNFKVHNKTQKFTTKGEIDFIDLSEKIQQEVNASGIKNGIVHVFAPHATGVLILTENDDALLDDIRVFLEELAPKLEQIISILLMLIRICGLCCFRQIRRCR